MRAALCGRPELSGRKEIEVNGNPVSRKKYDAMSSKVPGSF